MTEILVCTQRLMLLANSNGCPPRSNWPWIGVELGKAGHSGFCLRFPFPPIKQTVEVDRRRSRQHLEMGFGQPDITRDSYPIAAYPLRNGPFNPRSPSILFSKFGRILLSARLLNPLMLVFRQKCDCTRPTFSPCTLLSTKAGPTECRREPDLDGVFASLGMPLAPLGRGLT